MHGQNKINYTNNTGPNKINWYEISINPSIFTLEDYKEMDINFQPLAEKIDFLFFVVIYRK